MENTENPNLSVNASLPQLPRGPRRRSLLAMSREEGLSSGPSATSTPAHRSLHPNPTRIPVPGNLAQYKSNSSLSISSISSGVYDSPVPRSRIPWAYMTPTASSLAKQRTRSQTPSGQRMSRSRSTHTLPQDQGRPSARSLRRSVSLGLLPMDVGEQNRGQNLRKQDLEKEIFIQSFLDEKGYPNLDSMRRFPKIYRSEYLNMVMFVGKHILGQDAFKGSDDDAKNITSILKISSTLKYTNRNLTKTILQTATASYYWPVTCDFLYWLCCRAREENEETGPLELRVSTAAIVEAVFERNIRKLGSPRFIDECRIEFRTQELKDRIRLQESKLESVNKKTSDTRKKSEVTQFLPMVSKFCNDFLSIKIQQKQAENVIVQEFTAEIVNSKLSESCKLAEAEIEKRENCKTVLAARLEQRKALSIKKKACLEKWISHRNNAKEMWKVEKSEILKQIQDRSIDKLKMLESLVKPLRADRNNNDP